MPILKQTLQAWNTPSFNNILKDELENVDVKFLPLQQAISIGSYPVDDNLQVMIIHSSELSDYIRVKVGIFFKSIIPGCSCSDDPTPVDEYNEYRELQLDINKSTAETSITLLSQ